MTKQILPTRFQLAPSEVSTCFAKAQKIPPALPLFSGLPVAAPHLPSVVEGQPGALSSEVSLTFSVLAAPKALTTVRVLWPEVGLPLETTILRGDDGAGLVLVARHADGTWDLAHVADSTQAALLIEGLLPVSDAREASPEIVAKFPAAGLGVLSALGDRLRDAEMRARLARQEIDPEIVLGAVTGEEVSLFARRGSSAPDLRSATGRLLLLAPETLEAVTDVAQANAALDMLRTAKMIDGAGGLSARGLAVIRLMNDANPCAVLHAASLADGLARMDRIMFLRSGDRLFTIHWPEDVADPSAPVTVTACPPGQALRVLSAAFDG